MRVTTAKVKEGFVSGIAELFGFQKEKIVINDVQAKEGHIDFSVDEENYRTYVLDGEWKLKSM